MPQASYVMELVHGEDPKLVAEPSDSRFGLVFDEDFRRIGTRKMAAKDFYEFRLRCPIVSTRVISLPEKKQLHINQEFFPRPIRLLEFQNSQDRKKVLGVEHLNILYCNTKFYNFENLQLYIAHREISSGTLSITLENEIDKKFVCSLMQSHNVSTCFLEDKCDPSVRTIHLKSFPKNLVSLDDREFYIRRICKKNLVELETLDRLEDPGQFHLMSQDLTICIQRELARITNMKDHWTVQHISNSDYTEDNFGMIGLEGWAFEAVRTASDRLTEILKAIELPSEELTFGIGEAFTRSLASSFEVTVDIDKFNQKLQIYGSQKEEIKRNLEKSPGVVQVASKVPVCFPYLNKQILKILNPKILENLGKALGATKLQFNGCSREIEFEGSLLAYQMLLEGLKKVSDTFFVLETTTQGSIECPACCVQIGVSKDFLRFQCGHTMCRGCANTMVRSKISDNEMRIQCLECEAQMEPREMMTFILGENFIQVTQDTKIKYLANDMRNALVNCDPNSGFCTTVDCPGIFFKGPVEQLCKECFKPYCGQCFEEPHPLKTC
ncbi:hypothetical protein L5515_005172 [Caenorhabditis briggsae]|uniref:RING-type domain-containing protein n=1 Tax=Caenorhabditis briggsae TaxID=6238 RepID=A0AAE9ENH0_CAEBR|nr:hypothetical protein L5515_005172 [Caenorhabditis briggsae]